MIEILLYAMALWIGWGLSSIAMNLKHLIYVLVQLQVIGAHLTANQATTAAAEGAERALLRRLGDPAPDVPTDPTNRS